jgi:hypothetical protein
MPTVTITPARGTAARCDLRTHEVDTDRGLIRHLDSTWWNEHEARGEWSAWRPYDCANLHTVRVVTSRWCADDLTETHGPYLSKWEADRAAERITAQRCGIRPTVTVAQDAA